MAKKGFPEDRYTRCTWCGKRHNTLFGFGIYGKSFCSRACVTKEIKHREKRKHWIEEDNGRTTKKI